MVIPLRKSLGCALPTVAITIATANKLDCYFFIGRTAQAVKVSPTKTAVKTDIPVPATAVNSVAAPTAPIVTTDSVQTADQVSLSILSQLLLNVVFSIGECQSEM